MDCQFIFRYGKFVTSQTASFSRADINHFFRTQYYLIICLLPFWRPVHQVLAAGIALPYHRNQ